MGREVRRVPKDWEHPTDENGSYIPLYDEFNRRLADWNESNDKWSQGLRSNYDGGWKPIESKYQGMSFGEWDGEKPEQEDYMPDWPAEQRTHFQMYENTTEGTPISPVMKTPEELARWLADNEASAFANQGATYEEWLATIQRGSAVSFVMEVRESGSTIHSGVEAEARMDKGNV